jgi:hypothetical protein
MTADIRRPREGPRDRRLAIMGPLPGLSLRLVLLGRLSIFLSCGKLVNDDQKRRDNATSGPCRCPGAGLACELRRSTDIEPCQRELSLNRRRDMVRAIVRRRKMNEEQREAAADQARTGFVLKIDAPRFAADPWIRSRAGTGAHVVPTAPRDRQGSDLWR